VLAAQEQCLVVPVGVVVQLQQLEEVEADVEVCSVKRGEAGGAGSGRGAIHGHKRAAIAGALWNRVRAPVKPTIQL
jgi:hypothetical protein